jgi:hypothetical protein
MCKHSGEIAGLLANTRAMRNKQNILVEIFTSVTMKTALFWDIKPQFVPHRRHIISPLETPAG